MSHKLGGELVELCIILVHRRLVEIGPRCRGEARNNGGYLQISHTVVNHLDPSALLTDVRA